MTGYKVGVISINRKTKRKLDYYRRKASPNLYETISWNSFFLEVLELIEEGIKEEPEGESKNPENMLDKTSSVY